MKQQQRRKRYYQRGGIWRQKKRFRRRQQRRRQRGAGFKDFFLKGLELGKKAVKSPYTRSLLSAVTTATKGNKNKYLRQLNRAAEFGLNQHMKHF